VLPVEKANEIVSNYKAGGAAAELAKFFVNWEKHVGELSSLLAAHVWGFLGHHYIYI
jgi:hypothetical protein